MPASLLRPVVGNRSDAVHRSLPQPDAQPFKQQSAIFCFCPILEHIRVRCRQREDEPGIQADRVNRGRQAGAAQGFSHQEQNPLNITGRFYEPRFQYGVRNIFVATGKFQFLHAGLAQAQIAFQFRHQAVNGKQQCLRFMHGCRQFQAALEAGRRHEKGARLGQPARRPVQLIQECLAKTARHTGTRQAQAVGKGVHPDHFQAGKSFRRLGKQPCRQRGKGLLKRDPFEYGCFRTCQRQQPGTVRCRRAGMGENVAHFVQPAAHLCKQLSQAAVQGKATADFQQQPVRRLQADRGSEPARPGGQASQGFLLGSRIAPANDEPGRQCLGCGNRQAGTHPTGAGCFIAGSNPRTVARFFGNRQRLGRGGAPSEDFQWKFGEMQG